MDLDNKTYPLPLEITPVFTTKLFCMLIIIGAALLGFFFYTPIVETMDDPTVFDHIIFNFILPVFGILLIFAALYQNVLKQNKITITEKHIRINSLITNKEILWENVVDIPEFSLNKNDFIGFTTKARVKKLAEGGLNATMNAVFGGLNEISIPLTQLGTLDRGKVINTITTRFNKQLDYQQTNTPFNDSDDDFLDINLIAERPTNRWKALLISLLLTPVFGLAYGYSIYFLEVNILLIPFFGIFIISFYYGKYIQTVDYGFMDKLWIGVLGGISIITAIISLLFLSTDIALSVFNIIAMTYAYLFEILPNQWLDEIVWILMIVTTFMAGFSFGPSLNWFGKRVKE